MQIKELKQDGLAYEFEITIPANDIDKRVEVKLVEAGKTVKIQGFRPGKVPMDILKQRYGNAIMGEVLELAVNETSAQVFEEKSLKPAMKPNIEVKSFDAGADLVYLMNFEVLPEIKLADFKGIKLEKPVAEVTDEVLAESLETIAAGNTSTKKIEGKRATKDGDTVKMDFDGRTADDDVHHDGMKAEGHMLKLGSNQFIPGFEEQMIGKKAGDSFEVNVSFPEEYGAADLAGRDAIFAVTIHEIHEDAKSEIDDEFAKRLGVENVDALKDAVRQQLQGDYDGQSKMVVKKTLLDQLDDLHKAITIPGTMLESEFENIKDQIKADRQQRGDENTELTKAEEKEYREISERRVRLGLVLSEIGTKNNITVDNSELQQAVITEAQKYRGQEKEVFDYFSQNPQALEQLRGPLFEEKTVDFILELATVTEKSVSPEDLAKALDDDGEECPDAACGNDSCSTHGDDAKAEKKKPAAKKKAPAKKKTAAKKKAD